MGGYHVDSGDVTKKHDIYSPQSQSLQYIQDASLNPCNAEETQKLIAKLKEIITDAESVDKLMESIEEGGLFSCVVFEKNPVMLPKLLKHLNAFDAFGDRFQVNFTMVF